jgi:dTDP-glucose pyrophosphorylase
VIEKPLSPEASLIDAVRAIEVSHRRMAVVVDEAGYLLGTLTDGDIRRRLLAGGDLENLVGEAMNTSPLAAEIGSPEGYLKDLMRRGNVKAIPLFDRDGKYSQMVHLLDMEQGDTVAEVGPIGFSFAVIMAGGEGTRLRPFTKDIPKPMVKIGGVPLLERQIARLAKIGLERLYISVNYLSHIIEDYFGDGHDFGIEICYLKEQEKLGTAGALTLLPENPDRPVLVMNGDILTTSDLDSLYSFHMSHDAQITIAAIDYQIDIPYGVIRADGPIVSEIVEKPSERFLCNAGIYSISPEALKLLPEKKHSNMTELIEACLVNHFPIAVFPVHEYWNDIGTLDDLEKAQAHFAKGEIVE